MGLHLAFVVHFFSFKNVSLGTFEALLIASFMHPFVQPFLQ